MAELTLPSVEIQDTENHQTFGEIPVKEKRTTAWAANLLRREVHSRSQLVEALALFEDMQLGDAKSSEDFVNAIHLVCKNTKSVLVYEGKKCGFSHSLEPSTQAPRLSFYGRGGDKCATTCQTVPRLEVEAA